MYLITLKEQRNTSEEKRASVDPQRAQGSVYTVSKCYTFTIVNWSSSARDRNGTEESVHISKVSLFRAVRAFLEGEMVSLLKCPICPQDQRFPQRGEGGTAPLFMQHRIVVCIS